ncbi:MAG: hypothetical protein VX498_08225, partial [Myxococcota bacterium]|nr:hypothetical protein [Myxococcota bacterium]
MLLVPRRPLRISRSDLGVLLSGLRRHPGVQKTRTILGLVVISTAVLLLVTSPHSAWADGPYLLGGADDPNRSEGKATLKQ